MGFDMRSAVLAASHVLASAALTSAALLPSRNTYCHAYGVRRRMSTLSMKGAYDYSARDLDSEAVVSMSKYASKVSLVVNVASR